jgi:hypothetical protein
MEMLRLDDILIMRRGNVVAHVNRQLIVCWKRVRQDDQLAVPSRQEILQGSRRSYVGNNRANKPFHSERECSAGLQADSRPRTS